MNYDLKQAIQIFLTNYDKKLDDSNRLVHNAEELRYCFLFLEKSVSLLRRCMLKHEQ